MLGTLVSSSRQNRRLAIAVAATLGFGAIPGSAATFEWLPTSSTEVKYWSVASNWVGGVAPAGGDASHILIFGGPVGTTAGIFPNYTATNDFLQPFLVNQIQLAASDPTSSGRSHIIAGDPGASLVFGGTSPQLLQNGNGGVTFTLPIQFSRTLTVGGTGTGTVTLNGVVSGVSDITKSGPGTLRFGSPSDTTPSDNRWVGTLNVQAGEVRFNNNASAGRTALRANAVNLASGTRLSTSSELRVGTLSGSGTVETVPTGLDANSESIVIYALTDGVFSGALSIGAEIGQGSRDGNLTVRGSGTQTFTGAMVVSGGDVQVGAGATLVLAGNASLGSETRGAIVMNGGSFILDNTATKNDNRVWGAITNTGNTAVDTVGGGLFSLVGHSTGSAETVARLQLGSDKGKPRSGALTINVTHTAASAPTTLTFASYVRDGSTGSVQYTTVDFTAKNASGNAIPLGQTGNNPRILLGSNFTVPLANGLLNNTQAVATDVGWATVNGSDFATYGSNGIAPVTTISFPATGGGASSGNYLLADDATISAAFSANSVKIAPTAEGKSLTINASRSLNSRGYLLAGSHDYTIGGAGQITGNTARYFHVQEAVLNIAATVGGSGAIVKAGAGTLALTNTSNASNSSMVVINAGAVRAATNTLPNGELRFRGGVLEVSGGGTFSRSLGTGSGSVNWSGFDGVAGVDEDRGSGGFAAIGGDLTLDLGGIAQTGFAWEDAKFVNSGHALIFGSRRADSKINWVDNLNLSSTSNTVNYNARELRVIGHADSSVVTDRLQISGAITGAVQNDLLKTGDGVLELSGANLYQGATLVREGTLLVNGTNQSSFLTDVYEGAILGGQGTVGTVRIRAGGTLAPGELAGSPGQTSSLSVVGDLSFTGSTSKFQFELGADSYDRVNVNGSILLDGAELVGSLLDGFLGAPNDLFFLIINDGTDPIQGQFAQGNAITVGGQMFEIGYSGDSISNSFTGGNDLVLRAIPEPSATLLLGTGLALWAGRRRRRTASN